MLRSVLHVLLVVVAAVLVGGCATYTTPNAAANLQSLSKVNDAGVLEALKREPASPLPARLAVVRLQDPAGGHYNYRAARYETQSARTPETEGHLQAIHSLPMIAGVAPLNRILLPEQVQDLVELRRAAASAQADMVLVYTFDTGFRVADKEIGPLGVITLGTLPNQQAIVTSTASAALFDVRTGYLYGLAESTAQATEMASVWSTRSAVDETRVKAERQAFAKLVEEFKTMWKGVVETHAASAAGR